MESSAEVRGERGKGLFKAGFAQLRSAGDSGGLACLVNSFSAILIGRTGLRSGACCNSISLCSSSSSTFRISRVRGGDTYRKSALVRLDRTSDQSTDRTSDHTSDRTSSHIPPHLTACTHISRLTTRQPILTTCNRLYAALHKTHLT